MQDEARKGPAVEQLQKKWSRASFLYGSPSAYGLITDAMPVSNGQILVAASGYSVGGGAGVPLHTAGGAGPDALLEEVFPMLEADDLSRNILRMTFGDCLVQREHPWSRYCAALVEAELVRYLSASDRYGETSFPSVCEELGCRLSDSLDSLRAWMEQGDAPRGSSHRGRGNASIGAEYYEVSLGACRITPEEESGSYTLDILSAGNFGLFLLDGQGMYPLWSQGTRAVSPDDRVALSGRRVTLKHPEPFGLFLLSGTVCSALLSSENTSAHGEAGSVRARMLLERRLLNILRTASTEDEIGLRATQQLSDLAVRQDSISGAMATIAQGGYDDLRSACADRLEKLEQDLDLLPDGYDPKREPSIRSRGETEANFARELFSKRPELREIMRTTLADRVREQLDRLDTDAEGGALPPAGWEDAAGEQEGTVDLNDLTAVRVYAVLRRYDRFNDEDRMHIRCARQALHFLLAEHWITLRPLLCEKGCPGHDPEEVGHDAVVEHYACCVDLNRRLEQLLSMRRGVLRELRERLEQLLDILDIGAGDWTQGRADAQDCQQLLTALSQGLGGPLVTVAQTWYTDTDRFNALQSAYTAERELLFARDTADGGGFAKSYRHMIEGTWPEASSEACLAWVREAGDDESIAILDAVRVLSKGIERLGGQIRDREAAGECIREISEDFHWQFACLRAAVYGDETDADDVRSLVDEATRVAYRQGVQKWQEDRNLQQRRAEVYAAYRDSYGTYLES